ncbi:MAG: polymer-forming cytoskeletal protein [Deltaproteobacteria bacterium]|jgi:cytoskeletal protein CcmA (bactofilin family)|nr:polymer-forming cytoskeletal protein [Deltaproteobacteria bacterium]
MFGSSKNKSGKEWNAFFANNVEIEGSLRFSGLLNIDGKLKGAIIAKGQLVTGTNADIEGDVYVEDLILSGSIRGNIHATGEVHLSQSAKVIGNINYNTLSIVPGAVHEGNSHRFSDEETKQLMEKIMGESDKFKVVEEELLKKDKELKKVALSPANVDPSGDGNGKTISKLDVLPT